MANRSSEPIISLMENTCCHCLRPAWEVPAQQCNAVFEEDGAMIAKCDNCAAVRKDCVAGSSLSVRFAGDLSPTIRSTVLGGVYRRLRKHSTRASNIENSPAERKQEKRGCSRANGHLQHNTRSLSTLLVRLQPQSTTSIP